MRLMLHTLKKDARRLWPAAAVTWLMLAALANADRWRADWMPSPMEVWMNLLLSAAWACLAALVVLEEPLVGDRHFWLTRPHRWPALLAAKLIFVALAIHLPSFLADIFELAASGFSPASYLGDLLSKQILFFGWIVLPAMAVAVLVRGFTQFVLALFSIAAGLTMLSGGSLHSLVYPGPATGVHDAILLILLAGAAVAVAYIQYARRSVITARVFAIAAVLAAAAVSTYLPVRAEYAMRAAAPGGTPRIVLRNTTSDRAAPAAARFGQHSVVLPIAFEHGASDARFRIPLVDIEIVTPDGSRIQSSLPTLLRPLQKIDLMTMAFSVSRDRPQEGVVLIFSGRAWDRVKDAPVRIRGSAAFEFYHPGETTILPAQGNGNVRGLGSCTVATVDIPFSEPALKVLCESPQALPAASVTLRHEPSRRVWGNSMRPAVPDSPWRRATWLSPLHREQCFFRLTNFVASTPDSQWLVPASYLSSSRVEITPEIVTGRALVPFDFADVTLRTAEQ